MKIPIINVEIRYEHDVVLSRQRARQIAELLGFDRLEQVQIATAVSEIARNTFQYAQRGKVEFGIADSSKPAFKIVISDQGPGIAQLQTIRDGLYKSKTGMGLGILGAQRMMDGFRIESSAAAGTTVELEKHIPAKFGPVTPTAGRQIADQLAMHAAEGPYGEVQQQNQELLATMAELQRRQRELAELNHELEDTNRGVVALYAELDERADYLRRASEIKTRFLSNMTHEFRTPLNSILSLSRMLLDRVDGELTGEQEKQVNFIKRAANDLSELVNDLLDLAKVEAGKIVMRPTEFAVGDLFGALRGMLRPLLAHNSSIALVFDEPAGIPLLKTDESKVSQILRNFISNAIKYTETGEIRVSAAMAADNVVVISVADTGVGIAAEDQAYIFEEFTQVEGEHQKRFKGTGLGLPLSKKLAELLGGNVSVRSALGKGSVFSVSLPVVYHGATEVTYAPEVIRELDPTRVPVLMVDDNSETLFVYEKFLKGTGFQMVPARSVQEARQALTQFRPLAIVLDILLANESSWEFLTELKQEAGTSGIPVFVVTMVDNKEKALAQGATDFHLKPLERDWLLRRLRLLAQQRTAENILIIDDDAASRYVLRGLLSDTRYSIIEAAGGVEGIRLAEEKIPKVIFLDLNMPDLNGFAVLDQLKSIELTRRIPVIISTSKTLSPEDESRLNGRALAVLSKDRSSRENSAAHLRDALAKAESFCLRNGTSHES
jgi:signal transduction histidine kinase/CheY-like chemotaxis protein